MLSYHLTGDTTGSKLLGHGLSHSKHATLGSSIVGLALGQEGIQRAANKSERDKVRIDYLRQRGHMAVIKVVKREVSEVVNRLMSLGIDIPCSVLY